MSVETYPWPAWLLKSNPLQPLHPCPQISLLAWASPTLHHTTRRVAHEWQGHPLHLCRNHHDYLRSHHFIRKNLQNPKPKEVSNNPWLAMEQQHFCHPGSTLKQESLSVAILQPPSCRCHAVTEDGNVLHSQKNFNLHRLDKLNNGLQFKFSR